MKRHAQSTIEPAPAQGNKFPAVMCSPDSGLILLMPNAMKGTIVGFLPTKAGESVKDSVRLGSVIEVVDMSRMEMFDDIVKLQNGVR